MRDLMTYAATGVDYGAMDPFKRMAQLAGLETAPNIARLNGGEFREVKASRGESAYLIETSDGYLAHVEEGLGTKNLVADTMYQLTRRSFYDRIAQCTVAMIVNDMITLGALPLSVAMHLAVGNSRWFNDQIRVQDLVDGWKQACNLARCVWGGGETPTLKDMLMPDTCILSGSAIGTVKPKGRLITGNIQDGDAIVLVESSGIHANGLTLARRIADHLPRGYLTPITVGGDRRAYGDVLLDKTCIYVALIEECLNRGIEIHYAVNITGHGWRKLMRATQPFTYVIEQLPKPLPIFDFLQEHGPVDNYEAYGNLNMGAGFALYVRPKDVEKVIEANEAIKPVNPANYHRVFNAGYIVASKEKRVVIQPKGLEYKADTLGVR